MDDIIAGKNDLIDRIKLSCCGSIAMKSDALRRIETQIVAERIDGDRTDVAGNVNLAHHDKDPVATETPAQKKVTLDIDNFRVFIAAHLQR